jgi:ribosomal protein L37AE/L43A
LPEGKQAGPAGCQRFGAEIEKGESVKKSVKNEKIESGDNPWCENCKEEHCVVSGDGTCAMIRFYLKSKK